MIGPYRLERVLGTGSFATVWLAHDDVLDRQVAVKVLADNWSHDHEVRRRFLSEARVLLTAESPRIVRGFHTDETDDGRPYLVMAWADRGTLGDRIAQRGREGRTFTPVEAIGITTEIARALVDVHAAGHLHRDVKPSNVLIRSSSSRHDIAGLAPDETVVLADFGLARGLDVSSLTLVAGSPGYVAPEQAAGLSQLDRRADLYPLGRMLIEMLTGDAGGRATTMAGAAAEQIDAAALLADRPSGSPEIDPALIELICQLVAERPDERPSSADDVAMRLQDLASSAVGESSGVRAPGRPMSPPVAPPPVDGIRPGLTGTQLAAPPSTATAGRWRNPRVLAAAGAAVIVAIAAMALILRNPDEGSTGTTTEVVRTDALVAGGSGSAVTSDPATSDPATTEADATGPVVVTASPVASTEAATTEAATTEAATTESATTEAATTEPATTEVSTTVPSETSEAPTTTESGPISELELPAFVPPVGDESPNSRSGVAGGTPEAFVIKLTGLNPEWTGAIPDEPDEDGTISFELTDGSTVALVTVKVRETTAGALVAFDIDYS